MLTLQIQIGIHHDNNVGDKYRIHVVPFYLEYKYNRITKVPQWFHCVTGLKPNSVLSIQVIISSNIQMAAKDNYLPCKHD